MNIFSERTAKECERLADCQDFFLVRGSVVAVADGASRSFFSGVWAKLLVEHFCSNPMVCVANWEEWLRPVQEQWYTEVKSKVESAKSEGKPTWIEGYNGLNAKKPAASTFLGIELLQDRAKVCAIGDSCLFILRGGDFDLALPLGNSKDFNNLPRYFASYAKDNTFEPIFYDIPFTKNDCFVIATDALSEYILRCYEQGENQKC